MTTANPLAKDFEVYDLTADRVVDGPWPPRAETPVAVVAEPDALAPAKKKGGRPKGSKSKKAKSAKSAKAKLPPPPVDSVPETQAPVQSLRIAAGGEGAVARLRRIKGDTWLIIAAVALMLALGTALAFLFPPFWRG